MILETLAMVGCLAGAYTLNNQEDIKNRNILTIYEYQHNQKYRNLLTKQQVNHINATGMQSVHEYKYISYWVIQPVIKYAF